VYPADAPEQTFSSALKVHTPPASWSIHPGLELAGGPRVDVLTVHAATVLDALEATRDTWGAYSTRILSAPKGAGKTFALARVAGPRVVVVTDRRALASQVAEGFRAEYRLPSHATSSARARQATTAPRYSCTLHTVPRLDERDVSRDALVIDEASHVLGTLATGGELRGGRRRVVHDSLARTCARARELWLAQASWTGASASAWVRYLEGAGRTARALVVAVVTPEARGPAAEAANREALREAFLDAAAVGPALFASTSRLACEAVAAAARARGLAPLVVTGRTLDSPRVAAWLANPTAVREPCVLLSPAVVSGLSIHRRADGAPEYPSTSLEYVTWPGCPPVDDALQMVARVRGVPSLSWWATASALPTPTADELAEAAERTSLATAWLQGRPVAPAHVLDGLAAEAHAEAAASLGPTPRDALAAGLARDGWRVSTCAPTPADADARARRKEAEELAEADYLDELASDERGARDERTVVARLAELGLSGAAGRVLTAEEREGVAYLETNHARRAPVDAFVRVLDRSRGRARDEEEEEEGVVRIDRGHLVQTDELVALLLRAARVDVARLVAGAAVDVRGSDLAGFGEAARRHAAALVALLDVRPPRTEAGGVRSLASVLSRVGCERVAARKPGAAVGRRERVYTFALAPVVLAALVRRLGDGRHVLAEDEPQGLLFRPTPEDALAAMAPLRVGPGLVALLPHQHARADATTDAVKLARLRGVLPVLDRAARDGGLLRGRARRAPTGRIHLFDGPLQGVPKELRGEIFPLLAGEVFVSSDYSAAHVAVAAARTGDAGLVALVASEDAYAALAARLVPELANGRKLVKVALLAFLNGAGVKRLGEILGTPDAGKRVHSALTAEHPGLRSELARARALQAAAGDYADVPTLTGSPRRIRKGESGWRRLASALWTGPEAEALDAVLCALPRGSRLAVPMYDGVLLTCAREDAGRVAGELYTAMREASRAAGFVAVVKVGVGDTWAKAEEDAKK
jgi:hypothetical protein